MIDPPAETEEQAREQMKTLVAATPSADIPDDGSLAGFARVWLSKGWVVTDSIPGGTAIVITPEGRRVVAQWLATQRN